MMSTADPRNAALLNTIANIRRRADVLASLMRAPGFAAAPTSLNDSARPPTRHPWLGRQHRASFACLRREHLLQDPKGLGERRHRDRAEPPAQPLAVHGAELIEHQVPILPRETARDAERVRLTPGRQRRDDDRPNTRARASDSARRGRPRPAGPAGLSPRPLRVVEATRGGRTQEAGRLGLRKDRADRRTSACAMAVPILCGGPPPLPKPGRQSPASVGRRSEELRRERIHKCGHGKHIGVSRRGGAPGRHATIAGSISEFEQHGMPVQSKIAQPGATYDALERVEQT